MSLERLPVEPLLGLVGNQGVYVDLGLVRNGSLARLWHRSVRQGFVTVRAADQLAIGLLGLHPAAVWGDTWWVNT